MEIFNRIIENQILKYLDVFPVVAIVGPRQVGKTTTAKKIVQRISRDSIYLDLESNEDANKLQDAELYLNQRQDKLLIIDEIQRMPSLFPLLRSVIDKNRENGRFLILGSASPELLIQSSESLAGRIAFIEMHPLFFREISRRFSANSLWLKGGFPNFLMQENIELSHQMRIQFIKTYIERELPLLGLSASPTILMNLLKMMAHAQGQVIVYSEIGKSLGVDMKTVKRYIDYFENAFIIRRLQPFSANTSKRIVKSPKIFFTDSGLLHSLFNIETFEDLDGFNGKGRSWESFVIQQVIGLLKTSVTPYFYRTQDGTELDLVLVKGFVPIVGIEIKLTNSPSLGKGTTLASKDLSDLPVLVVTPSLNEDYDKSSTIKLTSFERLFFHLENLKLIDI